MPRPPRGSLPAYRQQKGYDQALVTLRDAVTKKAKDYWLGPYNTPQSRELYHRVVAEWEASGRRLIDPPQPHRVEAAAPTEMTVVELSAKCRSATLGDFGVQDSSNLRAALRVLVQLSGTTRRPSSAPTGSATSATP